MAVFVRLTAAIGAGLALAALLGLQAASGVAERRAPEHAVQLNPFNGMAVEQAAFRRFSLSASDPNSVDPAVVAQAAEKARPLALASYRAEPLVPKSLTILALAEPDNGVREKILTIATRLNRRDLALQLTKFQYQVSQADGIGTLTTLDQLLRVHPEYSERFFPALQQALLNPEAEQTFAAMLDGSSPWHEKFIMVAVRDAASRVPLARIRPQINVKDERIDRSLIAGLVVQGEFELAREMYNLRAKPDDRVDNRSVTLSWRGDFPPFDWDYIDGKEIRAKPNESGERLELFVRPGKGGVVATRIVAPPQADGNVTLRLDTTRAIIPGRMRASLYCGTSQEPVVQRDLSRGDNRLAFANDDECALLRIEIYARAYRSDPVLRASLSRIRIS